MSTRRIITTNTTIIYFLISVVVILAFLLLGGGPWIKSMMHGSSSIGITGWNWMHILISLIFGFVLGLAVAKRK